jgi:hypothetical protein
LLDCRRCLRLYIERIKSTEIGEILLKLADRNVTLEILLPNYCAEWKKTTKMLKALSARSSERIVVRTIRAIDQSIKNQQFLILDGSMVGIGPMIFDERPGHYELFTFIQDKPTVSEFR